MGTKSMLKSAASKVMWVGRATVFLMGLAVILALTVGVVSKATAHTGSAGLFHLGHFNPASAISTLVGTVSGGMLQVTNNSTATTATGLGVTNKSTVSPAVRATNSGGGPALGLDVGSGKAPMTVSGGAAKVANLDADKVDGKSSDQFANATHQHSGTDVTSGKVAEAHVDDAITRDGEVMTTVKANDGPGSGLDADQLDGKDSAEFIQRNPSVAQNGSIHVDGTLRTGEMLRTGSETGTSQGPAYNGLVVRRINSTFSAAGQVVARTDQLRLERDGSSGGLRIAWDANTEGAQSSSCLGINSAGQSVNHYSGSLGGSIGAGTAQVFTDAQGVVYATCSFGDPLFNQHVTQVTLQRRANDNYWIGTVISSFNQ